MPKKNIDYSNTIIYKIYCIDSNIKDVYVGHTTNFIKRKFAHKSGCNNLNNTEKLYKTIRDNGGWSNWQMIEIAKYNCKDVTEAKIREQEHYELLKCSLNSIQPYKNRTLLQCKDCELEFNNVNLYEQHKPCNTQHNNNFLNCNINELDKYDNTEKEINESVNLKFTCNLCNFETNNKKDFNRHLNTIKHYDNTCVNNMLTNDNQDVKNTQDDNDLEFLCTNCNKKYKSRVGLWKHKKICKYILSSTPSNSEKQSTQNLSSQITPELILSVLEQNKELTNLVVEQNKTIMELAKNGQGNSINSNNNINSNNKTFNLQFFLNETCKDAMNITDFVDSLKLQLSDLENVGKVGFVEGISSIIVKNLQALDVHKRPVHCADKKREIIYVKDENKWEKEDLEKKRLKKVIKDVAYKNERLLSKYKEEHPGCNFSASKYADQYSKIVIEAMGGMGNNYNEKEDKIIRNIAKEVVIDKKFESID